MKKILVVLLVLSLCYFVSCTSNSQIDSDYSSIDRTLRLNSGEKWKASGAMTNGMNKMNTIVKKLDIKSFDSRVIGYELDFEIRMMMSVCGATGEAHDQFHHYLDPLKEQIRGLQIANDIAKVPLLKSINKYLDEYENYFN
ncbi:hypothetical protein [uncultured Aquimarina sp.]|uniref:hypothetical protein n=1 Tax=uncultured Aquimarina sp. TaxID=575652 RepID=UPI0026253DBB|nr:hypothetical protein [uncultured Aquimarina sp.]